MERERERHEERERRGERDGDGEFKLFIVRKIMGEIFTNYPPLSPPQFNDLIYPYIKRSPTRKYSTVIE